ncbi:uncharacterized protein [Lepeophtheirus salmonis]|nr:uncharacterized protein LOC121113523 [Lepeophtheirus salmonis]
MDKVKFVLLLIFLASKKGETSASPENKLDSNVDLDLNIFGQRIILKNKNLKADDNIRIRQNDSFGILNEPSREKGLQSVQKHKDPFRHMMEMFHNALKFVKIDNILTHEEDVYEKYERPRRLENTRTIQQEINPVFNRIGLRDENEKVDVKTPPTPTTRPQVGQKRILTGTRRRKPSKIHRKPLVAIQMSTPPIRTLPPQHHRFIQHSTTVSPVTTPLAVKILPSFKPQNLPSRQRIRVKIPKNTSLPIIRQSVPDNVSPTNKPQIPSNPFIKTTNYIRQQTTPILFTKSQKTSPSRFIYPSSTSRPFIGIQSIDTNPIFTNSVKTLPLSSESFLSSKLPRPLSNLRSQSQAPSKGKIISSKPFNQFKKFKKLARK